MPRTQAHVYNGTHYRARVYKDHETGEFVVRFLEISGGWDYAMPDADYFTNDREDAVNTAMMQVRSLDAKKIEQIEAKEKQDAAS